MNIDTSSFLLMPVSGRYSIIVPRSISPGTRAIPFRYDLDTRKEEEAKRIFQAAKTNPKTLSAAKARVPYGEVLAILSSTPLYRWKQGFDALHASVRNKHTQEKLGNTPRAKQSKYDTSVLRDIPWDEREAKDAEWVALFESAGLMHPDASKGKHVGYKLVPCLGLQCLASYMYLHWEEFPRSLTVSGNVGKESLLTACSFLSATDRYIATRDRMHSKYAPADIPSMLPLSQEMAFDVILLAEFAEMLRTKQVTIPMQEPLPVASETSDNAEKGAVGMTPLPSAHIPKVVATACEPASTEEGLRGVFIPLIEESTVVTVTKVVKTTEMEPNEEVLSSVLSLARLLFPERDGVLIERDPKQTGYIILRAVTSYSCVAGNPKIIQRNHDLLSEVFKWISAQLSIADNARKGNGK